MSEDYAKGFKDGFAAGLEEGKKIKERSYMDGYNDGLIEGMKKTLPPPYVPPGTVWGQSDVCPKCGIKVSGVMGYVCSSINCPVFYKPTCVVGSEVGYTTGAVGSMSDNMGSWSNSAGANGPTPPDNNSVWVNGSWVSLGN